MFAPAIDCRGEAHGIRVFAATTIWCATSPQHDRMGVSIARIATSLK
jgi:hypothetical protein